MSIHKKTILLASAVLALVIMILLLSSETVKRSDVIGLFHFPAILIAVGLTRLMHGDVHSPDQVSLWAGYIAYSLIYWFLFLFVYALLRQFVQVRKAAKTFDAGIRRYSTTARMLTAPADASGEVDDALRTVGRALKQVEQGHQQTWFLKETRGWQELDDLQFAANSIAPPPAHALEKSQKSTRRSRVVTAVLKRFEAKLAKESGKAPAVTFRKKLEVRAAALARGEDRGGTLPIS